jgi:hypothetical protein
MAETSDLIMAVRHPLRQQILREYAASDEPLSPVELGTALDEPVANVSYHVRVLVKCKALVPAGQKPVRGAVQHFYVEDPGLSEIAWLREVLELDPKAAAADRRA